MATVDTMAMVTLLLRPQPAWRRRRPLEGVLDRNDALDVARIEAGRRGADAALVFRDMRSGADGATVQAWPGATRGYVSFRPGGATRRTVGGAPDTQWERDRGVESGCGRWLARSCGK